MLRLPNLYLDIGEVLLHVLALLLQEGYSGGNLVFLAGDYDLLALALQENTVGLEQSHVCSWDTATGTTQGRELRSRDR